MAERANSVIKPVKSYYRNGRAHRAVFSDSTVSFVEVNRAFRFRTINIGKWVSNKEQAAAAEHFYDALHDLMDILQVPSQVISLRSSLSFAYGAGGRPGAMAHYDASKRLFALAKNAGGGALAHEWFHAFDHYICQKMYPEAPAEAFASRYWLTKSSYVSHPLNDKLNLLFKTLFLSRDGNEISDYMRRCLVADKATGFKYYSRPEEAIARAFEAIVQDSPIKNHFLSKGTKQSEEARLGLYPLPEERAPIADAFMQYFHLLGAAMQRET